MSGGRRGERHRHLVAALLTTGLLAALAVAPATPAAGGSTAAPQMTLGAAEPIANVGGTLTLTATVATAPPASFTFVFFDDGTPVTCEDGVTQVGTVGESCTIPEVPAPTGMETFSADYLPSGSATAAATASTLVQVLPALTHVSIAASEVAVGSPVTYTATLTSPVGPVNSGSVTFDDDGTPIGGCSDVPVGNGTASCPLPGYGTVGTHDVAASYLPASSSTSALGPGVGAVVEAVGAIASGTTATSTTLTASSNLPEPNAPVTLAATVTSDATPPAPPTGALTFTSEGRALPGCRDLPLVPATGTDQAGATCQLSGLAALDSDLVQALFMPATGSLLGGSTSAPQLVEALPSSDALMVSATPDPAPYGASITLRLGLANTLAGQPSAPVQVTVTSPTGADLTSDASCAPGGVVDLTPETTTTCSLSGLPSGTTTLALTYPDTANATSLSSLSPATTQLPITVNPPAPSTTVTLTASPDPATTGQRVTYTAEVQSGSGTTPTGTVTFSPLGGGTAPCLDQPVTNGVATCITSYTTPGIDVVTAAYSGDDPSSTAAVTESVGADVASTPSIQLFLTPPLPSVDQLSTLTVQVVSPPSMSTAPTGTVSVYSGGVAISGCTDLSLGFASGANTSSASCSVPQGFGTQHLHSLVATYGGNGSTAPVSTSLNVTPMAASSSPGALLGLAAGSDGPTLAVAPSFAGALGTPTGTVSVSEPSTGSSCASANVTASPPVCDLPLPPPNTPTNVLLTYSGDATYLPAMASLGEETIESGTESAGLQVSAQPAPSGGLQLDATVSGNASTPTGTVRFMADGVAVSSCGSGGSVTLVSGSASCLASSLGPGMHTIVAQYSGDPTYLPGAALADVPVDTPSPSTGPSSGSGSGSGAPAGGGGSSGAGGGGSAGGGGGGVPAAGGGGATGGGGGAPGAGAIPVVTGLPTGNEAGGSPSKGGVPQAGAATSTGRTVPGSPGEGRSGGSASSSNAPTLRLRVPLVARPKRPVVYRLTLAGAGTGPLAGTVTFRVDGRPVRGCSAVKLGGGRTLRVTCRLPAGLATPGYQVVTADFSGGGGYTRATATALEQIEPPFSGGWLLSQRGALWRIGAVPSLSPARGFGPVVAAAATPNGRGLFVLDATGGVRALGAARTHGGGPARLAPYVGIAPTRDGRGYWLLARSGAVVARGDARPLGGATQQSAAGPFVAIAATPDGKGYWLLSARGLVVARGDAVAPPAPGPALLPGPYVAIAPSADGRGYTLLTATGRLLAFGDAPVVPRRRQADRHGRFVGLLRLAGHAGWWLAQADGHLLPVGGAPAPIPRPPEPAGPFVALAGT